MKNRIKKSAVAALGAAVAAVGLTSQAHASAPDGTVTYIISIDDNGFGAHTVGSFAIYAIDGTVNGTTVTPNSITANSGGVDGGLLDYNLIVTGANAGTLHDDIYSGSTYSGHTNAGKLNKSPYYSLDDFDGTNGNEPTGVEAGFTNSLLHHDDNSTQVAGGQDSAGPNAPNIADTQAGTPMAIMIFGLGQSAGNMKNFATSTTGNNPGTPSGLEINAAPASVAYSGPGTFTFGGNTYLNGLLVADGKYTAGSPPAINIPSSTTGLFAEYDEAASGGGYTAAGSATVITTITQTLTSSVPEPTSLGLIGLGAMGLLGRRRRRGLPLE
jgi:hypothetical protein